MQTWEYLFVFAAIASGGGEFRLREASDQELDDWQEGPTMYNYANQLGERGWELFSCHPIVFTQSSWQPFRETQPIASDLRAIEMVFKRPKEEQAMEEKTSTLNIRQTATYQYEVTVPETGATKTSPTLDSVLTLISHDILKHLTTHYLILVLADQHADGAVRSVDPQERPQTDLEYQAALEGAQLDIALQLERRKRDLVFELSRPFTREQAAWLGEHVGKLFNSYCIKDELEVQLDASLDEVLDNRKVAAHE